MKKLFGILLTCILVCGLCCGCKENESDRVASIQYEIKNAWEAQRDLSLEWVDAYDTSSDDTVRTAIYFGEFEGYHAIITIKYPLVMAVIDPYYIGEYNFGDRLQFYLLMYDADSFTEYDLDALYQEGKISDQTVHEILHCWYDLGPDYLRDSPCRCGCGYPEQ